MGIRYHEKKGSALEVAAELEKNPLIRATSVQLEPYNGWVVVVVPEFVDVEEIAAGCEIRDHKVRKNLDKKKPPAPAISPRPVSGSRSSSGQTREPQRSTEALCSLSRGETTEKKGLRAGWPLSGSRRTHCQRLMKLRVLARSCNTSRMTSKRGMGLRGRRRSSKLRQKKGFF